MPLTLMPGRPGRGYDPTAGFTDMQWYLYHQRNVAFFAAFSGEDVNGERLVAMARGLLAAAPHFDLGWRGAGAPVADAVLARLGSVATVADFDGFPDRWLDDGAAVFADPDLPLFRIRAARLEGGPDAQGRRSFILVQVSHALTEGSDSSLLSRSHSAAHVAHVRPKRVAPWIAIPARALGGLAALLHLLASRLVTPHPGTIRTATRAYPRRLFADWARRLGISQRALFLAIAAHVVNGAGSPGRKRKITSTYSTLQSGGGAMRDPFMRMRMLFAAFDNHPDFTAFAKGVEAKLAGEARAESGFNAELSAAAIAAHRRLSRRAPFLYGPQVFAFMPYDLVFGLLPPHRLGGALTAGLLEPVYAGAVLPGVNACVVVPGREWITFGFYIEESLLPQVARLDALLAGTAGPLRTEP